MWSGPRQLLCNGAGNTPQQWRSCVFCVVRAEELFWNVIHNNMFLHVEAGSNTSTVTLRVVGVDEKGSLNSETVKDGPKYQGTRTKERLRWQGPAAYLYIKDPSSRQRGHPTRTNPQLSDSNKDLVVSPKWVLYSKTDWPAWPSVVI
jgi:hypothetical protein